MRPPPLARLIDAVPLGVEQPSVVAAADAGVFHLPVVQRCPAVAASRVHEPDAAIEVPEEDEVLAEHADVRRPGGRFLTAGEWLSVPAQELTAGGARAHAGQLRVERGGGSAVRCAGLHPPNLPRLPVR